MRAVARLAEVSKNGVFGTNSVEQSLAVVVSVLGVGSFDVETHDRTKKLGDEEDSKAG